ncbi:MAG TPA: GNAT family N-acetyltransferase [Blastocatellia bacterium]|nr:GNAT family N-acetyltransferase [Blastocatellia bacterium]
MANAIAPGIILRDVETIAEMREVEALQKEVWGIEDLDVVPMTQLVAAKAAGGVLAGAFAGGRMVGFVYGFVGQEAGHVTLHSHMLAVKPEYRNHDLGYKLKLIQRERALASGIRRITWTFDPLQCLNAHFNFAKLGVVSDSYRVNFYGEETSSFLHRIGTDRLWVTWLLDSRRVRERIEGGAKGAPFPAELEAVMPLLRVGPGNEPEAGDPVAAANGELALIEIPGDIQEVQKNSPEMAHKWRETSRWAFTHLISRNYLVEDFYRVSRAGGRIGVYVLRRGRQMEDFE